jgi:ATPase subunit of ABC transporter with duplicated ATPase domains
MAGTLAAEKITKEYGVTLVLDGLSLTVPPRARIGVVGPNGSGKSTLLRILAGVQEPDRGRVVRRPPSLTVGYLPQQPDRREGETLLEHLARRTGVAAAEAELQRIAHRLEADAGVADAYDAALGRFLALGGADLAARARQVADELGLRVPLDRPLPTLSGGEAARVSLAALLLARHDVLCLDEPTNDLDFAGLDRLERFVDHFDGALVCVSHDREFLDRTVRRILSFDAETRRVHEFAGRYGEWERARELERSRHEAAYSDYAERRDHLEALLDDRRNQARAGGAMADRRGTQALRGKVKQAQRHLERLDAVEKPWSPWRLQLSLDSRTRAGDTAVRLHGAIVVRGGFRFGPVDLDIARGERLAVTGANGSGKTTLLGAVTGEISLAAGTRELGAGVVTGTLDQRRELFDSPQPLLERFCSESALSESDARTLLAKFGLRRDDALRPAASLSPGERSRATLALLQARGVNMLVLDEPTNHLDLEAIEKLELAVGEYGGTVLLVTHDRRLLERFDATRVVRL